MEESIIALLILLLILSLFLFFALKIKYNALNYRLSLDKDNYEDKIHLLRAKENSLEKVISENSELIKENTSLKTIIDSERKSQKEKLEILQTAKDSLKVEFENLSNRIFEEKGIKAKEINKESLNEILNPFKEQIKEFKEKVEKSYDSESKERALLEKEIRSLKELNTKISQDAVNLTNALQGDKKKQGCWGEVILERVLLESGLRKDHEYELQVRIDSDKQPDAVVHLDDEHDVIIDSKVTLNSYVDLTSSLGNSEDERNWLLNSFLANIQNHIKGLANKRYEESSGVRTVDYVLMFIPIESAFLTALESKRDIFSEAFKNKVVIVSPATLLIVLKTIKGFWRYREQSRNAEEIAKAATSLYDKFYLFSERFFKIGKQLQTVQKTYNETLNIVEKNLAVTAENMKALGLTPKKNLNNLFFETFEDKEKPHDANTIKNIEL